MSNLLTPSQPNPKNLKKTLALLKAITTPQSVVIRKEGHALDRQIAQFSKSDAGGFQLKYDDPFSHPFTRKSMDNFILEGTHIINIAVVADSSSHNTAIDDHIEAFDQVGFTEALPAYHRLIFPLKESINFTFCIQQIGFQTENHKSTQCVRVAFDDMTLDLYCYKDRTEQSFLLLDSTNQLPFTVFSEHCFSSLISLGYIMGKLVQDEAYNFSYDTSELDIPVTFGLKRYRKSISSIFIPIYANAGGYVFDHAEIKRINPDLRSLTSNEFSRLCRWAHTSFEFKAILLLIIEATKTSLAIMPAAYAVAMEGITDLIVSQHAETFTPVKDKLLAKDIRVALKTMLTQFESKVDVTGLQILQTRIDNINQLTNRSKLIKPFEFLKITLSEEDIKAIEHRNDFLHGRITYLLDKDGERTSLTHEASSQEIYYTALRLYTLLAALILKSIGYDNKIVNHPKIQRRNYQDPAVLALLEKEDYFRQI